MKTYDQFQKIKTCGSVVHRSITKLLQSHVGLHRVPKNVIRPTLFRHNSDIHEVIFIIFGTIVTEKVDNHKALYVSTALYLGKQETRKLCIFT